MLLLETFGWPAGEREQRPIAISHDQHTSRHRESREIMFAGVIVSKIDGNLRRR